MFERLKVYMQSKVLSTAYTLALADELNNSNSMVTVNIGKRHYLTRVIETFFSVPRFNTDEYLLQNITIIAANLACRRLYILQVSDRGGAIGHLLVRYMLRCITSVNIKIF